MTATSPEVLRRIRLEFSMPELRRICEHWKIRKLGLFGSVVRDDFAPGSDVDVLYEAETPMGWEIADFREELRTLFGGRDVELVGYNYINWRIRNRVLAEAVTVYERE